MSRLTSEEKQYVATVATFVDREVRPVARDLEHTNTFPAALIERMAALGVFGLVVPAGYGGAAVSPTRFAAGAPPLAPGGGRPGRAPGPPSGVWPLLSAGRTGGGKRRR